MSRVGILGGTFDPPHAAHAAMARAARERLGLERVLFMPAPAPPHKRPGALSNYAHRLAMARIAVDGLAGVEVSRFEERRAGPSYSADTLRSYRDETGDEVYFIIGSDSLAELATWHDPAAVLSLCTLVVFLRPDHPIRLDVPGPAELVVFEEPSTDLSSTAVREAARRGEPIDGLVSDGVLRYIRENGLYTQES